MTEPERRERQDAEIAAFHELMGDAYRIWIDARPRTLSVWTPLPANDDAPAAANDNIDMDEAA